MTIDENVRALRQRTDHTHGCNRAIFLAVVKAKANMPIAAGLTPLGRDEGAILPQGRSEHWFDLGLGRADLRFGIRTADNELQERFNQLSELAYRSLANCRIYDPKLLFDSGCSVAYRPRGNIFFRSLARDALG